MLRRFLLLLLLMPAATAGAQPGVMIFGDSLSAAYGIGHEQGWVSLLADRLQRAGYPQRVINASISGDTTAGGLTRLESALERHAPRVLVIELGGNDGLRGFAPATTKTNLDAIIRQAQSRGIEVMMVGVSLPPNYGAAFNSRFLALYRDLADSRGVPLVILSLDEIAEQPGMLQADGIHPSAEAQPMILDLVWPALRPLLGKPG